MTKLKPSAQQPAGFSTLLEVLEWQAASRGDRPVFTFEYEEGHGESLTFGQLAQRSKAIAARLQAVAKPGERVLLVFPAGLDFVCGFFGCVAAGVLAVPATYPKPKRPMPRLTTIAQDCGAKIALTTSQTLGTLDLVRVAPELAQLTWICVDTIPLEETDSWQPPRSGPDEAVFLQYTSGSTSQPKGVVVTHANLLCNLEMIRQGFGIPWVDPPEQPGKGVFWLPAYHDMGLIGGILSPLYTGGHSVLMAPTSFLQSPARWLRTISRFRALVSGGPNFGYQLCLRKVTSEELEGVDLSCWEVAFCGAEPIRAETLACFAETFGRYGFRDSAFYPCYGLAEATLLATGRMGPSRPRVLYVSREELAQDRAVPVGELDGQQVQPLVGCGTGLLGEQVRIVHPETCQPLLEGQVGEIWIKGPNVAVGYWDKPDINARIFRAFTEPDKDGPYLRTGDLGFLYDGELFVTGRLKEVIIIRGRNYYPQDIELTVQHAHPALIPSAGAAFSVEVEGEERLVIVQEVDRRYHDSDFREITRQIRRAVAEEFDLDVYAVVLIRQASLPRTTSGKIQRMLCREKFLTGQLKVVAEWRRKDLLPAGLSSSSAGRSKVAVRHEGKPVGESGWHPLGTALRSDSKRWEIPASAAGTARSSSDTNPHLDNDGNGRVRAAGKSKPPMSDAEIRRLVREIEESLLTWLVERAGVDPSEVDRSRPFAEYGLDSLTAVELTERLEQMLNLRLSPTIAWNYPTPAALAEYLANLISGGSDGEDPLLQPASTAASEDALEAILEEVESFSDDEASAALKHGTQEDYPDS
jgi:acyl-CoA synthetase (AMP-forming)/AMP-acid ligase II/acyl carrier protein